MTDQEKRHVFISYVRENQKQVDRLCQDLKSQGVNVWLDRNSIKPGARWKDAIREAIRHGDFFIACFSDDYTSKTKTYMNEELTLATEELRQYASDREWFIPVLLSECDVPARSIGGGETLLDINWVPLYENWDAGIHKILSVIKPIPPEIQNLLSALRSEGSYVRLEAVKALNKIGGLSAVPALVETLKDKNENIDIRRRFAETLGQIGSEAKAAVPDLIEILKNKKEPIFVRRRTAEALGKIGSEAKAAVPALIEALKDENISGVAALALGKIGSEAKAAVPDLIEILKNKKEAKIVRWLAAEALKKINTSEAQCFAVVALGEISPEAVPDLIEALKDEDEFVRWRAAEALGEIAPEAKAAVPVLIEALKDQDKDVREAATQALRDIGPEAKAAVPALVDVLKDEDGDVRSSATQALEKINTPEAQKALYGNSAIDWKKPNKYFYKLNPKT